MMETKMLDIRLQMERLISEREGMKALNEWRARRGESQAYDEEAFMRNGDGFEALARRLGQEAQAGLEEG